MRRQQHQGSGLSLLNAAVVVLWARCACAAMRLAIVDTMCRIRCLPIKSSRAARLSIGPPPGCRSLAACLPARLPACLPPHVLPAFAPLPPAQPLTTLPASMLPPPCRAAPQAAEAANREVSGDTDEEEEFEEGMDVDVDAGPALAV